jgi:hypothetical protein
MCYPDSSECPVSGSCDGRDYRFYSRTSKSQYKFMFCNHNPGENRNIKIAIRSFENVAKLG